MKQQTPPLEDIRKQIDEIDDQLVRLLNERASAAQQVRIAKSGAPKFNVPREAEVLRRVRAHSPGPLPEETLKAVFREIISGCLSLQQQLRVSYLGPEGTFSEEAARQRFGVMAEFVPHATLDETLRAAETGAADVAVLPIENSNEGSVGRTLDLLLDTPLTICDEMQLHVHHQVMSKAPKLQHVKEVAAHPQALAQCRAWLAAHLPHASQTPASSNSEAARRAADHPGCAAIASRRAAELHRLTILASDVEDDPSNTTRFIVLGGTRPKPTGTDKTSLVCVVPNAPGALTGALAVLSEHDINMVKLESRPARSRTWEYVFYIDIEGHQSDDVAAQALRQLKKHAAFVKVIGSYPKEVL